MKNVAIDQDVCERTRRTKGSFQLIDQKRVSAKKSHVKKPFLNFSADKSKLNPYVFVRWVEEMQVLIPKDYGEIAKIFEIVNPSYPIIVRPDVPEDITDPDERAIVCKQNLKLYISRLEQLNEIKKKVWAEVMDTLGDMPKTKVSAMVGYEDDRNEYNVLSLVKNVIVLRVHFAREVTDIIRAIDLIEQELHNIHEENDVDVAKYKKRWDACVLPVRSVWVHVPPLEQLTERYISRLNRKTYGKIIDQYHNGGYAKCYTLEDAHSWVVSLAVNPDPTLAMNDPVNNVLYVSIVRGNRIQYCYRCYTIGHLSSGCSTEDITEEVKASNREALINIVNGTLEDINRRTVG